MNKTILVFGHIPKWFGGKQSSGLSNVMYQLAFNMANLNDSLNISFIATDLHKAKSSEGRLKIFGWNKKLLISYILNHLVASIGVFLSTWRINSKLYNVSIFNLFVKRILLKKYISVVKPDLVHFHGVNSCYLVDIVPENVKIIVTMHHCLVNDFSVKNNVKYLNLEEKICKSKRINAILFITNQVKDEFNELYGPTIPKSEVILQGYEQEKYYYIDKNKSVNDKITLCTVGSIAHRKGQMRVMEALKTFNSKFNYMCIGGGDEEIIDELEITAKKYNISFEYKGIIETEKIRETMAIVDYMILPSIKEGFGVTYIESIACGVPIIAPKNTPLVQENILNKSNSILIENESVEAIKTCLAHLDLHNFDRKSVSQSLPNIGWKEIAKEYEKLIVSL
jgi:glycosyltransferase involved in cell wall biosynthesis